MYDSLTPVTMIHKLAAGEAAQRGLNLERFVSRYGAPLRAHLIRKRLANDTSADDLVHDFMVRKFLEPAAEDNLASRYLQKRAEQPTLKFRAYILRSLDFFAIDEIRKDARQAATSLDEHELNIADETGIFDQFEIDFANNILNQALNELKSECERNRQLVIWLIFDLRIARPARTGEPVPSYAQLVDALNLRTPKEASNRLQTAIRKFNRILRRVVADYLPLASAEQGEAEIESELRDLRDILLNSGNVRLASPDANRTFDISSSSQIDTPSAMFAIDDHGDRLWLHGELQEIWNHWLAQSLQEVFHDARPDLARKYADITVFAGCRLATLADLWAHPTPPLDALQALKREAKASIRQHQSRPSGDGVGARSVSPTDVCFAIYMAAVGAARVRLQTSISRDDDESFQSRLARALAFPWLDKATRELFATWLHELKT